MKASSLSHTAGIRRRTHWTVGADRTGVVVTEHMNMKESVGYDMLGSGS